MTKAVPVAALPAFLLVGMLLACTHRAGTEELATVERMIQATDTMRAELDRADTNNLRHMGALFTAERPAIEARFRDTLQPHEAEVLGNYHRAMAERLPRLMAERQQERLRVDSTAGRLHNLRHDMELGLMPKDKRAHAIQVEQAWIAVLRKDLDGINDRTSILIGERKDYRLAIDSLLRP